MGWEALIGAWQSGMDNNYEKDSTETTQKNLSQEAIDKLIYDVMSSDAGLASLVQGETLAGGSRGSTKSLMAQDFTTKLIGELANVTAATTRTSGEVKTTKEGRLMSRMGDYGDENNVFNGGNIGDPGNLFGNTKTVICTELYRQGKLSEELYELGGPPSRQVSYQTWLGYICWAESVVERMKKSERLSNFLLPIVVARYEYLLNRRKSLLGALTIYIGHPACWLIGSVLELRWKYGRAN